MSYAGYVPSNGYEPNCVYRRAYAGGYWRNTGHAIRNAEFEAEQAQTGDASGIQWGWTDRDGNIHEVK